MSLMGYIRIKLTGGGLPQFINVCQQKSIKLNNIKKIMNVYFVDVKSKYYKDVISIANDYGIQTEINGRFGLVMKLILYKSRKAFFVLAILLSLYYGVNSMFISEISINGNKIFTDSQLMEVLNNNDLYVGRLKFGINPEIFQNEVIMDMPGISWIWLRIDGTKAIVDVREKISRPEFYDYSYLCNVVASKEGVITSAVASSGTLVVTEGMYVKKGDILINGVYDSSDFAPVRFVNAAGTIHARTSYTIEDNFGFSFIKYTPKTKLKTVYTPKILNTSLWSQGLDENKNLVINDKDVKFKIFGKNYLPLAFTKTKYCEIIRNEYTLSKSDAEKYAIKELTRRLNLLLPEGAIIDKTHESITPNSDGTFKASLTYECIEDITTKLPIEVEME